MKFFRLVVMWCVIKQVIEILGAVGSIATAAGVWFAFKQLDLARKQSVTAFEDSLSRDYREFVKAVGKAVFLTETTSTTAVATLDIVSSQVFSYLDLCNTQVFLRSKERVSKDTWADWEKGIRANLKTPVINAVWIEVKKQAPDSFNELRWLEDSPANADPVGVDFDKLVLRTSSSS